MNTDTSGADNADHGAEYENRARDERARENHPHAALVDDVLSTGAVDPSRIYAMGVSKGGMMAYHAAYGLEARANAAKAKAKVQSATPMLPVQRSKSMGSEQDSKIAAAQKRFDANPSPDNAAMLIALTS